MSIYKFTDVLKSVSLSPIKGVYIIDFGIKKYIGSSKNILARLNYHRVAFRRGNHYYSKDVGSFNECDVFFKVYEVDDILELEVLITEEYRRLGFALNQDTGNRHSKEHLRKLSESRKGRVSPRKGVVLSEETKSKLSKAMKGKPWSLKRRLSQLNRNNKKQ